MVAGTHVVDQTKVVTKNINDTAYDLGRNHAANFYDQPDMFKAAVGDMAAAGIKNLQDRGLDTPDARKDVWRKAQADAAKSAAEVAMAKDPKRAISILDGNQEALGAEYGPLRRQADEAYAKVGGKALADQSKTALGPGYKPATTPVAMAVGDSTADGVKTYGNLKGDTLVGRPSTNTDPNKPPGVLESIKAMPQAPAGTPLVIGTGLMNDVGPSGDISRANPAIVKAQIDAAKAKGYTPLVLGVGDKYANLNPQIKQIAEANGAKFVPLGPNDGTHATDGYKTAAAGAMGGSTPAAPGEITTGPAANIDRSIPAEGRALLATIGGPEAGGQYDVRYGGAHFSGYGDHPRVHQVITSGPNAGRTSDAAGRYQFLSSTWDEAARALHLTDFSPDSQDKAAWWLAQRDYHRTTGGDLLQALKSGDPSKLAGVAQALHGTWTSLPGGIEEGITSGKFAASYGAALQGKGASTFASREPSPRPATGAPGSSGPGPQFTSPNIHDAAFNPMSPVDPSAPPRSPEDIVAAIAQDTAKRLQWVDAQDVPWAQKEIARREIDQQQAFLIAEAQETQRAIKAREDQATDDVLGLSRKGNFSDAFKKLDDYVSSHQITEKMYRSLSQSITQDTGEANPRDMGKKYTEGLTRMMLPRTDPNHIGSLEQLLEMKLKGDLTTKGFHDLNATRKELDHEDEYGIQTIRQEGLKALEKKLSGGGYDPVTGKPGDRHGLELYNTVGVARYNTAFNAWRQAVREGKADPTDFALSDPKKLDAFANSIYPKQERDYLRMRDQDETLPEIPERVDPKGWGELFGLAKSNTDQWGAALAKLASDPQNQAPLWDAKGPGKVISAENALAKMRIPYTPRAEVASAPLPAVSPTQPPVAPNTATGNPSNFGTRGVVNRPSAPPARELNPLGMTTEEMDAMRGGMDREAAEARNFHHEKSAPNYGKTGVPVKHRKAE